MHIKRRLPDQAVIFFNCIHFQDGSFSFKGNNLLPEGANSFLYEQFLMVWKITLSHRVTSHEFYYFYYARAFDVIPSTQKNVKIQRCMNANAT